MRHRLRAAVRALLDDPALRGQSDAVRLAAVVLAAKTNAGTGTAAVTAHGLGRWLGVSESLIDHTVLPALRKSSALRSHPVSDTRGKTSGLRCNLLPLQQAWHDGARHPLALRRSELATLLRLSEALFGPGWTCRNGTSIPPGLLAQRRGRGAATDRLAFLLMALDTRRDGRVRMCPGIVDTQRGRPAVTIARMMGCSASGGAKILTRLSAQGVTHIVRLKTRSGLQARSHILLPAIAHASASGPAANTALTLYHPAAPQSQPPWRRPTKSLHPARRLPGATGPVTARNLSLPPEMPDHPTSAPKDHTPMGSPTAPPGNGLRATLALCHQSKTDLPPTGPLHTPHTPGVADDRKSDRDSCAHSGAAVWVQPAVAGSARTGATEAPPLLHPASASEMPAPPPPPSDTTPNRARPQRALPRDVHRVLASIPPLRDRLRPTELNVACAAITAALRTFSAQRLSAELASQLAAVLPPDQPDAYHLVRSPLGWLLARLPPITLCPQCDRTWHGARRGKQTCPRCTSRPTLTHGPCHLCGQMSELTPDDICGECCLDNALVACAEKLCAQARPNPADDLTSDDLHQAFQQRMQETRRNAAVLGLNQAGQRLAVRLAAHSETATFCNTR